MQSSWQFGAKVKNLYISFEVDNFSRLPIQQLTEKLNEAISRIYNSGNTLDEGLFDLTKTSLDGAVDKSVNLKSTIANKAFINELKTSNSVFAAFKNHQQSRSIAALLHDKDGKTVPFSKFKKEALKVSKTYNKEWLKTEYNTALRRGRIAGKFHRFRSQQNLYPNLRWIPSTASQIREEHAQYYGLVLPVNDSFWVNNFPGNAWNCKCDVQQTKDPAQASPSETIIPPEGLEGNPAFTGQVFGSRHPYFSGLSSPLKTSVDSYVQTQTDRLLINKAKGWFAKNSKPQLRAANLQTGLFQWSLMQVKQLLSSQKNAFVKSYIEVLTEDLPNLVYVGYAKEGRRVFSYYQTNYGKESIFLKFDVVNKTERPIAILSELAKGIINTPIQ